MKGLRRFSSEFRRRFTPFLAWIGEIKNPTTLRADIVAGVTVALVLIPQSMAYAQLAGLPPYYGLYASFIPGIVAALFGSSRQLATGPVAVVSLMTAAALEPLASANPELFISYALLLAMMVGVFQMSLGLLRLGILVDFLSHPVVIGFTNAAAIIIGTSQLGKLFGVDVSKTDHHYEKIWQILVEASQHSHIPTVAMAVLALGIMIVLRKYAPRLPAVLTAVAVTTFISWAFKFEQAGGAVVGAIPQGIPLPKLPDFNVSVMLKMSGVAVAISLIGFMEAISIAKAMAAQTRQRLDPNQELVGQGLANITSSLFQGYAVSGSFSRSAVNISAGAVTGFSSVITGAVVGITLLALTPLLYHLPQAALAAVIIMAVVNLVKIEPIKHAWKVQVHDGVVAIITFVLTLVLAPHLEWGIIVGVVLSLGLYIFRTMRPRVVVLSRHKDGTLRDAHIMILPTCSNISVLRFDGELFFANTGYFENKVLERVASKPELKFVILDAESINGIDATGEEMLRQLVHRLDSAGVQLIFARAKRQIMDAFEDAGFFRLVSKDYFFRTRTRALQYAWEQLGDEHVHDVKECPLGFDKPLESKV